MTGAWSRPPAGRVSRLSDLGELGDKISEGAGESLFVCTLRSHPGWLYKAYSGIGKASAPANVSRLDRLIGLPGQMPAPDRAVVDARAAWPGARVVNPANQTTGVLLPMAPAAYKFEMTLPGGRSRRKYLEVDHLAQGEARQRQLGLPGQSLADRISVCASIAATAELLERHGLVYLDWSYANLFWRPADHSAYLIDLDGVSFGPRPQIHSPQWDDPHVPRGEMAGNSSDRYRVALLITSCLTGKRVYEAQARSELSELRKRSAGIEDLAVLLLRALTADAASRPAIAKMKAALDAVDSARRAGRGPATGNGATATAARGGVAGWTEVRRTGAATASPFWTPPRAASPPAPASAPPVPADPGFRITGASAGRGGPGSGTGPRAPVPYPPRTPAKPSSNGVAVAVKTAAVIVAVIVLFLIIVSL